MTAKYFAILTNQGAARLANAAALGTTLNITQMAVGDANGVLPTPDPAQTALINQKRIAALNMLSIDPNNSSQIIAEQVIPENEGGYWIREIGLYDDSGVLVAVANCPETYKPLLQEGSGRTQTIRMVLIVSSTAAVTLKIDPAVVLATRQYVDNKVIEVKAYADNLLSQHIAASNPHTQYAPIASPTFTGTPKAPTAAQTANDTQLATTAFVKAAIATLVNGAPATLDTLAELATALGNNPNFATTMTNALAGKQPLDSTLTALSGKSVAVLLEYLGLGDGSALPVGTPVPWPTSTVPTGWLKCNGATFTAAQYPKLALAYPGLVLPDLRGEFIRGWDDGRGADSGRSLLSAQGDAIRNITGGLDDIYCGASAKADTGSAFAKTIVQDTTTYWVTNGATAANRRVTRLVMDASSMVPTANENRPRNVAFNYIVRAA
ncbi:phage tail protein [Kosakonia radicincitans]|uniref:phage tail protein n=1 Tax=Kosakonia radicincitans TaxID=283686 RepID=UPI0011EE394B|nr:phage tail protein [Kosakonia radicincitans]QEM92756.1 phage tail protein [Kosakonia radicincitans]